MTTRRTPGGGWACTACGERADGPANQPGPRMAHQTACVPWNAMRAGALVALLDELAADEAREWGPYPALTVRWEAQLAVHMARLPAEVPA